MAANWVAAEMRINLLDEPLVGPPRRKTSTYIQPATPSSQQPAATGKPCGAGGTVRVSRAGDYGSASPL